MARWGLKSWICGVALLLFCAPHSHGLVLEDMQQDEKKSAVFMARIVIPEKYERHTIGGILAIPVERFIVTCRAGDDVSALTAIGGRPIQAFIPPQPNNLSSTKIRQMIQGGESVEADLLSPEVRAVIARYNLYAPVNRQPDA